MFPQNIFSLFINHPTLAQYWCFHNFPLQSKLLAVPANTLCRGQNSKPIQCIMLFVIKMCVTVDEENENGNSKKNT